MNTKKWTVEQIAVLVQTNNLAALRGCAAILKLQTMDERAEKQTKHKNRVGFSIKHGKRATLLVERWVAGRALTEWDYAFAREVAYAYREQLLMIANCTVSENHADAVKGTSDIVP